MHGSPFDEGLLPLPEHFVGRVLEQEWLAQRLRSGNVTSIAALRGMGGIGKTTLAAVVVRQLRKEGDFPDGIAVLLCQDMPNAQEILRRILARFDPRRKQPEAIDAAGLLEVTRQLLGGKKVLVVLDNLEPGIAVEEIIHPL